MPEQRFNYRTAALNVNRLENEIPDWARARN